MTDDTTCAVCGESVNDSALLAECRACGALFHLNPRADIEGIDCGDVWTGDAEAPALQFHCQPCIDRLRGGGQAPSVAPTDHPACRRSRPVHHPRCWPRWPGGRRRPIPVRHLPRLRPTRLRRSAHDPNAGGASAASTRTDVAWPLVGDAAACSAARSGADRRYPRLLRSPSVVSPSLASGCWCCCYSASGSAASRRSCRETASSSSSRGSARLRWRCGTGVALASTCACALNRGSAPRAGGIAAPDSAGGTWAAHHVRGCRRWLLALACGARCRPEAHVDCTRDRGCDARTPHSSAVEACTASRRPGRWRRARCCRTARLR